MRMRFGRVKLDGKPVGTIEGDGEQTQFAYSAAWLARTDAVPISVTLPAGNRPE